ncbi:STM3941 family protein [Chryseobacterium arthrosphaerae]|uniref:STM3941 family protein n=1 Tax=Chryseobacterium arthrosphaerae TaxID=651561 RepID=UPI0031D924D7
METKVIKVSNKKFLLLLIGSLIFTIFSILFIMIPNRFTTLLINNMILLQFIGTLGVFFFGFALLTMIRKRLLDKNMGIIINGEGIIDNSSFVGVGLIKWEDIVSIEKSNVLSTNFLLINVKNPETYINLSTGIKSKLLKGNDKSYGTPISISSNFVNCSFSQLEEVIMNSFEKYKMNN